MKQISIFLLLLIIGSIKCLGQSASVDAKKIDSLVAATFDNEVRSVTLTPNDQTRPILNSILKNYIPKAIMDTIKNDLELHRAISNTFRANPFFQIAGGLQSDESATLAGSSSTLGAGGLFSFGSSSATIIADGIGKFLAKRTKQELNVLFFDRFREFLDTHPEIA